MIFSIWGVQLWMNRHAKIRLPALFWPGLALLLAGGLSLIHVFSLGTNLQAMMVLGYFFLFYLYMTVLD